MKVSNIGSSNTDSRLADFIPWFLALGFILVFKLAFGPLLSFVSVIYKAQLAKWLELNS